MSTPEIDAPAAWRSVDFISDLHLQSSEPENFLAWKRYLRSTTADAVFILGDLFEVWVGDDVLDAAGGSFERECCAALRSCSEKRPLYFMHGNRDFLLGQGFAQASGMQMLSDPTVLHFAGQRYLLSHGDALCLADTDYQAFRSQVRSIAWQAAFLATPLSARIAQARKMREMSEAKKKTQQQAGQAWVDVDLPAAQRWMHDARAQHMIHGHTHEGCDHAIAAANGEGEGEGVRHVLPDWHRQAGTALEPQRGYVLRLKSPSASERAVAQHIPLA